MATHFDSMTDRLKNAWKPFKRPTTRRAYRCQCGRPVFFRNSECLYCHTPLGYDPACAQVLPLALTEDGIAWRRFGVDEQSTLYRRCANFRSAAGCNWLLPMQASPAAEASPGAAQELAPALPVVAHPEAESADAEPQVPPPMMCAACRLNRTIPDLSQPENQGRWAHVELAKRRLVSQLIALGLPVVPKTEDSDRGIAFDFLGRAPDGPPVMTGHDHGVITLNIEEADDVRREQVRAEMREPYRTLLGHFRHEIGHYYWDLLVDGSGWLPHFRALFGDERLDYAAALKANYEQGPPADWPQRFVSAYASTHPWEDWAETWAHYLHMVDTVDTALSFGIDADEVELEADPWTQESLWQPAHPGAEAFLGFLNAWVELTAVVNEMSRSMGQHDFYPFVLPHLAVAKLQFIHLVVQGGEPPPAPAETVPAATIGARPQAALAG